MTRAARPAWTGCFAPCDVDPSALAVSDKRKPAGDLTTMQRLADRGPARPGLALDPHSHPALAAALGLS